MTGEFQPLQSNGIWSLVPRPNHQNIIHNKWVYRIKQRVNGSMERFKARLVAKGFEQKCGLDYTEAFSPVIKPSTTRILLSLVVRFEWNIRQLDVSNAFLHGKLSENVFMEQPRGFVDPLHPNFVCKLHKALYGLKQAFRAWFNRLSSYLLELGFTASLVDSSLFIMHHGFKPIFILVYMDDIIITGPDVNSIHTLITKLQVEFPLKDLGPLHFFLGIEVSQTTNGLHLCQAKYISDLLHRTNMQGAKPAKSPCSFGLQLSKSDGEPPPYPTEYRHVVGSLQYCTLTSLRFPSLSINFVSMSITQPLPIYLLPNEFFHTSSPLQIMVYSSPKALYTSLPTVTVIGQEVQMIVDHPRALLSSLAVT